MSTNIAKNYGPLVLGDILSCFGIPTATVFGVYQDILDKRAKLGLEILLSEIRQGDFSNLDQDDVVSVIARYQRDAVEGIARNNLHLLARMIRGMADKKELQAASFSRYANILSSLTEKEMRVLSVMAQYRDYSPPDGGGFFEINDERHKALLTITTQAEGHMQALMRTGLVNMVTNKIDYNLASTNNYQLTNLMDEILSYIGTIQS